MTVTEIKVKIQANGDKGVFTRKINGKLLAAIISNPEVNGHTTPVHITLRSGDYQDIIFYDNVSFQGVKYIPIKTSSISENAEVFNYSPDYFFLNERVLIQARGSKEKIVEVILRIENA